MKKLFAMLAFAAILPASDDIEALEKSCDGDKAEDCVYLGFWRTRAMIIKTLINFTPKPAS